MLGLEPVVAYNDEIVSDTLIKGDVLAVFLNIELSQMDAPKIIQLTHRLTELFSVPEIPVFFMYHKDAVIRIKPLLELTRTADIIKPFSILDIYRLLRNFLRNELTPTESDKFRQRLAEFRMYCEDLGTWLEEHGEYA